MTDKIKGSLDDMTDVFINEVMPDAVKWLLNQVPEDQYEKIFQEKKKYWNMILPFFSFALLRLTNSPKIVDDITTEFFSEVRKEINRRAGEVQSSDSEKGEEKKEQKPSASGESLATTYVKTEIGLRKTLTKRLGQLDEEERVAFFKINLPQKDAQQIIKNLATCEESEFPELVSLLIPKKKKTAEPSKHIDAFAEMAKHQLLLKRFTDLTENEKKNMLSHLANLPANQIADHLQVLEKMDDPNFQLYVKNIVEKEQERIWPQTKKVGEGLKKSFQESFNKWQEKDKTKQNLSSAFKAGIDSRRNKQ